MGYKKEEGYGVEVGANHPLSKSVVQLTLKNVHDLKPDWVFTTQIMNISHAK